MRIINNGVITSFCTATCAATTSRANYAQLYARKKLAERSGGGKKLCKQSHRVSSFKID